MEGFTIAGKTGTAAKLVNGHYSHTEYNASFVGFMPSRSPVVAIAVVIDSPHGPNRYFGGTVAAPIFKRIATAAVQYLGIPPSIDPPPPVLVARNQEGSPRPATVSAADPVVSLVADAPGTIPDLHGLSARDAVRKLVAAGVTPHLSGAGVVISQTPTPGTPIDEGARCDLLLARTTPRTPDVPRP